MARIFAPFDEHHPDFFARVKQPPREHHFTGRQHTINEQTYMSEDEPDFDVEPEFDLIAYNTWRDAELEALND